MTVGLVIAALALTACGTKSAAKTSEAVAKAEPISGSALKRVTLLQKGADRLGLQTAPVQDAQVRGTPRKGIPSAAVLYDSRGGPRAYPTPGPLPFARPPA